MVPRGSGFGIGGEEAGAWRTRPQARDENPQRTPTWNLLHRGGAQAPVLTTGRESPFFLRAVHLSSVSLLSCEVRDLQASPKSLLKGAKVLIILLLMWLLSILPENGTLSFKVTAIFQT